MPPSLRRQWIIDSVAPMSPKSRTFLVATALPRKERREPSLADSFHL